MRRSKPWFALRALLPVVLPVMVMMLAFSGGVASMPHAAAQDGDSVVMVNGEPITRDPFHARVRFVRWQYLQELETLYEVTGGNLALTPNYVTRLATSLDDPVQLGDDVLYQMEEELLLRQTAADLALAASPADTQAQEDAFFSLWTNVPVSDLAGDADAQAFITSWYDGAVAASGLSRDDIRVLFEVEALRQRLYEHFASSVPAEELAVNTRHVLCAFHPDNLEDLSPPTGEQRANAENCAQTVMIRLANGESFEAVAMALSDDLASAQLGGDVGWQLLSYLTEPYAEATRGAELNTVIGPVESVFGFHVIEVLDRAMQALTADEYESAKQGYFGLWTDTLHADAAIERRADWNAGLPAEPGLNTLDPALQAAIQAVREGSDS